MTAQLTRLRIAGFKSFAEPVSLDILPGLTGIVGPNGCGKSNVVEALRWAMGETSARSLRGGEMDDVIFAGTSARPSRNLAEVAITLAAEPGGLPAPFAAECELQVTRRIERGAGSQFRANGREMRARDVQTLYADLASGARSSGMVSQGRVAALVNAKPEERRAVLEEAAGISGLHARRHEAELKLRAAEQNLERAEDLRAQLDGTSEGLRRQARQAARYRNISGLIRAAETEHLAVLQAQAQAAVASAAAARETAREEADLAAQEVARVAAALAEAEAALPAPREAEALARSTLERRRLEAEQLSADSARLQTEAAEAQARLQELESDLAGSLRASEDAAASVQRLEMEAETLTQRRRHLPAEIEGATARREAAARTLATAQHAADLHAATLATAEITSRQAGLALQNAQARAGTLRRQVQAAREEQARATASLAGEAALLASADTVTAAEAELAVARAAIADAEAVRAAAQAAHQEARAHAERDRAAREAAEQRLAAAGARAEQLAVAAAAARQDLERKLAARIDQAEVMAAEEAALQAGARLAEAEAALEAAERAASVAAAAHAEAAGRDHSARATRLRAEREADEASARADARAAEEADILAAWQAAEASGPTPPQREQAEHLRRATEAAVAHAATTLLNLAQARQQADAQLAAARAAVALADADLLRLAAEAEGLAEVLGGAEEPGGALAALELPDGLEFAVASALGESGESALDGADMAFWRALPALPQAPELPAGSVALTELMACPAHLARALSHVAVLEDGCDGGALQAGLAPGVVAVTRAGAAWRWDGHVRPAGAPSATAMRLRQRRRLAVVCSLRTDAEAALAAAQEAAASAGRAAEAAAGRESEARASLRQAETELRMAREAAETLQAEHLRAEARRAALRPELQRRTQERQKASEAAEAARRALAALEDGHGSAGLLRDAARASELAGLALEQARTERLAARLAAASSQTAQQNLAAACLQAEARLEAARLAAGRAEADLAEAIAFQARIGGELDALADPAEAEARLAAAADALQEAGGREETARARRAQAEQSLDAAREADARLRGDEARTTSLLAGLSATLDRLLADLQLAGQDEAAAERAVADCPDQAALAAQADAAREDLRRARLAAADAETELSDIMAEARRAEAAAGPVAADLAAWRTRLQDAGDRVGALTTRRDAADLHMRALSARPAELEARAAASTAALAAAQVDHQAALSRLHAADQLVRGLAIAQRDAEQVHAAARERLVRTDAEHEAAFGGLQAVLARVKHRLAADAVLPACADCSDAAEERARKKYERLSREREEMGPVNLRAELELEEIEQRIAALAREHEELTTAIARLRGAIGHLNREGRERLSKVFAEVDQHFRALFTRMMGGGRAHLALTGSEDPLQAGLEIYAEPPGKKLSSLSLLSGGEQALTALSLVFAVFRCTPAPISVLDEVDAPLDDANVERFCSLLDDMVRHTGTRFLVVTHHQLTMSRMDRLFGVTMQERGVSRLLSVDLHRAIAMVEPALQAAE